MVSKDEKADLHKLLRVINLSSHASFCVWLLRYNKRLVVSLRPLLANPLPCCDLRRKTGRSHMFKTAVVAFTTPTSTRASSPSTPPSHPHLLPLLPFLFVKTFVKSYFPLIKYSCVLQMYAWITCHTLSLLGMAPR